MDVGNRAMQEYIAEAMKSCQYHAGHCHAYTKKAQSFDWALFLIGVWQWLTLCCLAAY